MDAATFRTAFPAFADSAKFPDARVAFWLSVGGKRLSAERWGDLLDQGLCLFAAHNMTLETAAAQDHRRDRRHERGGRSRGLGVQGRRAAVQIQELQLGDHPLGRGRSLESTIYGQQFYELMQLVGVGGLHL